MSAENLGLGQLIDRPQQRDAIHVAVIPMICGAPKLKPGEHIGLMAGSLDYATNDTDITEAIGVVDPFLKHPVRKGDKFWMFLYPGSITSLRHEWTHPAFVAEQGDSKLVAKAKAWIANYADVECDGLSYQEIMDAATAFLDHGTHLNHGGRFEGIHVDDEFWHKYEIVTGRPVENYPGSFFSCSC